MSSWSTRGADATVLLGMAFKLKKNNVLTPAFQRGKFLSTGRKLQLVGDL